MAPGAIASRQLRRSAAFIGTTTRARRLYRWAGVDLTRIDGVSVGAAQVILTEVGLDLSAFPSEKHFTSWLRLVPRTAVSGGKPLRHKKTGDTGSTRAASVLRMAALSLQRSRTALGAAFRRTARYKGGAVAIFASARKLAILVYQMLRQGQDYVDLGEAHYEARFRQAPPRQPAPHGNGLGLYTDPGHRGH